MIKTIRKFCLLQVKGEAFKGRNYASKFHNTSLVQNQEQESKVTAFWIFFFRVKSGTTIAKVLCKRVIISQPFTTFECLKHILVITCTARIWID